jgi:hypothetical protein
MALIVALLVTVFISRFVAVGFLTMLLANFKNEQPFFSSIAMISIGEFSLLVAKESKKFALGVDLVTITAAIIFISAIIMSIGINYSESIHFRLNSKMPIRARLKLEKISDYMRRFFDQMEIENFFTKKLKAESKISLILVVITIFAFFVLRRASSFIKLNFHQFILYIFYIFSSILMIYLLKLLYKRLKAVHHTLSVILTHVDSSRNLKKCTRILNNLLLALLLFFSAMLFPFVMFALNLSPWVNITPLILLLISLYYIKRLIMLIDASSSYVPSYAASMAAAKI